jgi:hypothetical protein
MAAHPRQRQRVDTEPGVPPLRQQRREWRRHHSPGALSGNVGQAPTHIPINLRGNTLNGGGFLYPAFGNPCINR